VGDTAKFCRECGARVPPAAQEAATWRLPSGGGPGTSGTQTTSPVKTTTTGEPRGATGPAYTPPAGYYAPAPIAPIPRETRTAPPTVSLGQWLSEGWGLYKQNWLIMSLAAMFGAFLTACSVGILAGPMLMGLFRMAFRTMRGERPEMGDLFKWEGKFFQAFLAALAFGAIYFTLIGVGGKIGLFAILKLVIGPLITIGLGLTLPLILERGKDVAAAINEVAHLIYKREGLMWWVTGLVFSTIIAAGLFGCVIGIFVTAPWIICASAVAYRHFFGVDDPNRTLP
jgi:hypothetical protein